MQAEGWQDEDWIGRGLKYSAVQHQRVVQEQLNLLLHIPATFNKARPLIGLSLKTVLSRLGHVLQKGKAEGDDDDMPGSTQVEREESERVPGSHLLSPELPNTSLEKLFFEACMLPWSKTIQEMNSEFHQRWLDGTAKSIVDWTDPNIRYPLAALTVYREFDRANDMRIRWHRAEKWMSRGKQSPEQAAAVSLTHKLMFVFEWDSELRAMSTLAHSTELIDMLSNKWLSDTHVDMLLEVLTRRTDCDSTCADVLIAPCIFQQYILQAYNQRNDTERRNIPLLEQYRVEFTSGRKRRFFFIAHINNNHWVPWKLDILEGFLGHGDSMATPDSCMSRIRDALQWWISGIYEQERDCAYRQNIMAHGVQSDSYSCGVVSYNTMAHEIFGDELWTAKGSKRFRIDAFNSIILHHNTSVSIATSNGTNTYLWIPQRAKVQQEPLTTLDSMKAGQVERVPPQRQGLEIPLDSHRALDSSVSILHDHTNASISIATEENSPLNGPQDSIPPATTLGAESSQARLLHEDAKPTLVKKETKSSKRDRATSVSMTAAGETSKGDGRQKKKQRLVVHGDREDGKKDEQEDSRGNAVTKDGATESHEPRVGFSKSQLNSNRVRDAILTGTFIYNEARFSTFKAKILALDRNALFDRDEKLVLCSRCNTWKRMRGPYDTQNFKLHLDTCNSRKRENTLDRYLGTAGQRKISPNKLPLVVKAPCSGLTERDDPRIRTYLLRPGALGGGGQAKSEMAINRFGRTYSELDDDLKDEIDRLQEASWAWRINHRFGAIFSISCKKTVSMRSTDKPGGVQTNAVCGPCRSLAHNTNFKQALRVPAPDPSNFKHINLVYLQMPISERIAHCKGLGVLLLSKDKQVRVAVRFAKGVANGEFKEHAVFRGLVEAFLTKLDRENAGKALTNLQYTPEFAEFMSTVQLLSTRAYALLSEQFAVPSVRNMLKQRAKEPQFWPGISPRSFELIDTFMSRIGVPERIIALSADDTKLHPKFRTIMNREERDLYLVGGVGEPLLVSDPARLRDELAKASVTKATKVRIWVATVPLPKIPPIVIAAMAITEEVTAAELTDYTQQIINGLHERNVWTVSYACDGTEKERANQRNLRTQAHSTDTRRIRNPSFVVEDTIIQIPLFNGRPTALMQDSLHARKTIRNNLGSGSKTMVLGNHCPLYKDIREMAFHKDSPLYHRDVEKTDKQDDRAAARLFSSGSLEWFTNNAPEKIGTIIFLFIFGELIDAAQNRSIDMLERTQMIFRAKYFKEIWVKYLREAGYPLGKHCLSREALDICTYQTDGFLELLYIYRDYMDDSRLPLLPWLHSSEPCEHIFGELRKQVKDFDFADFLHLVPKSHFLVQFRMKFGRMSSKDAKQRASGYAHTWFDIEDLSLTNLRTFPTDEEIDALAKAGFRDAVSLWEQLGLCVTDMRLTSNAVPTIRHISQFDDQDNCSDDDTDLGVTMKLPSLVDLVPDPGLHNRYANVLADMPTTLVDSKRAVLERMLELDEKAYETGPIRPEALDAGMLNISCAKLILDLDTTQRIEELHVPSAEEWATFLDECACDVGSYLVDSLPPLVDTGERLRMINDSNKVHLSVKRMLHLRHEHETQFARKAVRTTRALKAPKASESAEGQGDQNDGAEDETCEAEINDSAARIELVNSVLKLQQDVGIGTGLERSARWKTTDGQAQAGNAANAAAAASKRSAMFLAKRTRVYSKLPISIQMSQLLSSAGICMTSPLREDSFGIIFHNKRLFIARVMSIYSKTGGINGKHTYRKEVTNIGDVSYISVQTYEEAGNRCFREIHASLAYLSVASFAHLTPNEFLCSLPDSPTVEKEKNMVILTANSYSWWMDVLRLSGFLTGVMKDLKKRNDEE